MKPLLLSAGFCLVAFLLFSVGAWDMNPGNWDETTRWLFVVLCLVLWFAFFMGDKIGRDVDRWEKEGKEKQR